MKNCREYERNWNDLLFLNIVMNTCPFNTDSFFFLDFVDHCWLARMFPLYFFSSYILFCNFFLLKFNFLIFFSSGISRQNNDKTFWNKSLLLKKKRNRAHYKCHLTKFGNNYLSKWVKFSKAMTKWTKPERSS